MLKAEAFPPVKIDQDLGRLPIMAPPLALQREFIGRYHEAQSIIIQQTAPLTKSRKLLDALLAQTFSTQSIE